MFLFGTDQSDRYGDSNVNARKRNFILQGSEMS